MTQQRSVERNGQPVTIVLDRDREGVWRERRGNHWLPIPGAADATIAKFFGVHVKRVQHYGPWDQVPGNVAAQHPSVLQWCHRYKSSHLANGGFRFEPSTWDSRSTDVLADVPFIPEFDDPEPVIRRLAATESEHRWVMAQLQEAADERRRAIEAATQAGYSRRRIGHLLNLSFGRVQQLLQTDRGAPQPAGRHRTQ